MEPRKEIHAFATFVHGALVTLHVLGVVYNARKGNRWQTWAHLAGVAFSAHSTVHHIKELGS